MFSTLKLRVLTVLPCVTNPTPVGGRRYKSVQKKWNDAHTLLLLLLLLLVYEFLLRLVHFTQGGAFSFCWFRVSLYCCKTLLRTFHKVVSFFLYYSSVHKSLAQGTLPLTSVEDASLFSTLAFFHMVPRMASTRTLSRAYIRLTTPYPPPAGINKCLVQV